MKSRIWNYFKKMALTPVYAGWIIIFLQPWLNLFYKYPEDRLTSLQLVWLYLIIIISSLLAELVVSKVKRRFIYISLYFIFNPIFIYSAGWEFSYFAVLFLLFSIFGFRHSFYGGRADFSKDFIVAVFFLIFSLMIDARADMGYSYYQIISFFVLGSGLNIYYNYEEISQKEKLKTAGMVAGGLLVIMIIMALIIPGRQFMMDYISPAINWLYFRAVDLFIYILYPLLWLITPIYNMIRAWLGRYEMPEQEPRPSSGDNAFIEELREMAESQSQAPSQDGIPWLLYIILGIIIFFLIKKLWNYVKREEETGFSEERESLLKEGEFKKDIKLLWNNIKHKAGINTLPSELKGESSLKIVRRIYFKFLVKNRDILKKEPYQTPNDYLKNLHKLINLKNKYLLDKLTSLYNKARYREKLSVKDARKAEKIWEKLKEK